MCRLSAKIGRPVTFALIQVDAAPDLWRELMDASLAAAEQGADVWPQIAGRATGLHPHQVMTAPRPRDHDPDDTVPSRKASA